MTRAVMVAVAVVLAVVLAGGALRAQDLERQFKAAMNTELVSGDLKAAIEQYRKVADGSNRALAAQALLRMAECYQKLGDAQARTIFERVVREFADQAAAVTLARARLGTLQRAGTVRGDRAVWTGPRVDLFGRVSPDGKFITYVDWSDSGNLMVHDLVADADRAITSKKSWNDPGQAGFSAISPDGAQVVYAWDEADRLSLRIAALHTAGVSLPRPLLEVPTEEVRFLSPYDWSPDGKWIAVSISRRDGTGQIAAVSATNGSVRILKSVDWRGPERMFFSRDSKYIAYDLPATGTEQRDVFVIALDGSRELAAVVHSAQDGLIGWSPGGGHLLFSSDRTGTVGLWAQPFADGKPLGPPDLLRTDIASGVSLGLTTSGALYLFKGVSNRDVKTAPIDLIGGKLLGAGVEFTRGFLDHPGVPDWSPDGKQLAYHACGGDCIAIRTVENGEVRKLPRKLLYARAPRWSPDGRSLITAGRDSRGRDGVFQVDAHTGEIVTAILGTTLFASPVWSPDGTRIYYLKRQEGIVERDMISGTERDLLRHRRIGGGGLMLSPDGRYIAVRGSLDPSSAARLSLLLVSTAGGELHELLRLTPDERFGSFRTVTWTPDSRAVIALKVAGDRPELWLLPIDGDRPRKLDIDADSWTRGAAGDLDQGFSLSPDGRNVAFLMGKSAAEVWAIENFLPPASRR